MFVQPPFQSSGNIQTPLCSAPAQVPAMVLATLMAPVLATTIAVVPATPLSTTQRDAAEAAVPARFIILIVFLLLQ